MTAFLDTSFLYAVYVKQSNSPAAANHILTMKEPLHVSELLLYEFRQSLRFQVWRHLAGASEGLRTAQAETALNQLEADISNGIVVLAPCHWLRVIAHAEQVSRRHTIQGGHRGFDILHVATALHLGAKELLTFDQRQRRLAEAEGLEVKPRIRNAESETRK